MQLSLVAYYGEKPDALVQLISKLQDHLRGQLSTAFRPYAMAQVHGTILGMEAEVKSNGIYNKWFSENKGIDLPIDFKNLIPFLQNDLPRIQIRIGGYHLAKNYGFSSREQHPFLRSFSVQGNIAVAMGWPVQSVNNAWTYTKALFKFRQAFETFHLCHKWNQGSYQDNDFFFVLGKIDKSAVSPEVLEQTARELQELMALQEEVFTISKEALSIVVYEDTELPLDGTQVFSLNGRAFSEKMIKKWYSSVIQ